MKKELKKKYRNEAIASGIVLTFCIFCAVVIVVSMFELTSIIIKL